MGLSNLVFLRTGRTVAIQVGLVGDDIVASDTIDKNISLLVTARVILGQGLNQVDRVVGTDGLVNDADGVILLVRSFVGDVLPGRANVDSFALPGCYDVLAMLLCILQPFLLVFTPEIALNNEAMSVS